jgi:hypothetical protein
MGRKDQIFKIIQKSKQITSYALQKELKISRQMTARYLRELLNEKKIQKTGSTKSAVYYLFGKGPTQKKNSDLKLRFILKTYKLQEDQVFEQVDHKLNLKRHLSAKGRSIAWYAFSEMLNNAIDHSQSKEVEILVGIQSGDFYFEIRDKGIGIFKNVQKVFKLNSELDAISHVLKGKQTTWPEAHSGQGIFFTSKIADTFNFKSHNNEVLFDNPKDDVDVKEVSFFKGTKVGFRIKQKTKKDLEKLFRDYANEDFEFDRSVIKFKKGHDLNLISRSQARRLLNGLEKYDHITFDFSGMKSIGQGYADEVFRVYQNQHPKKVISWINANKTIEFMIRRAIKKDNPF